MGTSESGQELLRACGESTVASLFFQRALVHPDRVALEDGTRKQTYRELAMRVRSIAMALRGRGIGRGDCIAFLSENRAEVIELFLAAANIGAIVACQNWRLAVPELAHCLSLVEPALTFVSTRHAQKLADAGFSGDRAIELGAAFEQLVLEGDGGMPRAERTTLESQPNESDIVRAEDILLVLYTSGTTGLPKGAMISHRAEVVRNLVVRAEYGLDEADAFVAWSPLYHMGGAEYSLGTLMSGGTVIVVDGFDRARLVTLVRERALGWLLLMPGTVGAFVAELESRNVKPRGVKVCGVMADLVPPHEIAKVTRLLDAPFANTFGATETGNPPCSRALVPIGVAPQKFSKVQSAYCEVRLVDPDDRDVPDGTPGELAIRGPTLFSGYFRAPEANAHDFRGGFFHMGDVFVRNADGTLDFVDRVKYLIKSGGENVYPAEIERVLLAHPGVADAAVVRKKDEKWGEVPVAFVAVKDASATEDALRARCRQELAGYKQPKELHFIAFDAFPRSASGKVQRHELEKMLPPAPKEPA